MSRVLRHAIIRLTSTVPAPKESVGFQLTGKNTTAVARLCAPDDCVSSNYGINEISSRAEIQRDVISLPRGHASDFPRVIYSAGVEELRLKPFTF